MKKLILSISLLLMLSACSSAPSPEVSTPVNETETKSEEVVVEEVKSDNYYFEVANVDFTTGDNATEALSALGDPLNIFKAPSCAFEGEDTVYKYDDFEIYTYEKDGQPHVSGIFILNDKVSTPEGLRIGSTVEELFNLYGEPIEDNVGAYTFLKGNTELIVVTMDDVVSSITYILKV